MSAVVVAEVSFVAPAETAENAIDYNGSEAFAAEIRRGFEDNARLIRALGLDRH